MISRIYVIAYIVYGLVGVGLIAAPPRDIRETIGAHLMLAMAAMSIMGGLLGSAGATLGLWWAEKTAVCLTVGSTAVYGAAVLSWTDDPGELIVRIGLSVVAATLMVARLAWPRWPPAPSGGA